MFINKQSNLTGHLCSGIRTYVQLGRLTWHQITHLHAQGAYVRMYGFKLEGGGVNSLKMFFENF